MEWSEGTAGGGWDGMKGQQEEDGWSKGTAGGGWDGVKGQREEDGME